MRLALVDLAGRRLQVHDFEQRESQVFLALGGLQSKLLHQRLIVAVTRVRIGGPAAPYSGFAVGFAHVELPRLRVGDEVDALHLGERSFPRFGVVFNEQVQVLLRDVQQLVAGEPTQTQLLWKQLGHGEIAGQVFAGQVRRTFFIGAGAEQPAFQRLGRGNARQVVVEPALGLVVVQRVADLAKQSSKHPARSGAVLDEANHQRSAEVVAILPPLPLIELPALVDINGVINVVVAGPSGSWPASGRTKVREA